jgi:hypothetical protein
LQQVVTSAGRVEFFIIVVADIVIIIIIITTTATATATATATTTTTTTPSIIFMIYIVHFLIFYLQII